MPQITSHTVIPNDPLTITTVGDTGPGGAYNSYEITAYDETLGVINFQNGPVNERGNNGVTIESLLAISAHVLASYQAGPFACVQNESALMCINEALSQLNQRTRDRISRQVEGQYEA